jgi:hypothetical protein
MKLSEEQELFIQSNCFKAMCIYADKLDAQILIMSLY